MGKWFDETRLSRFSITEIGIAFYIRDIMKNRMQATYSELCSTFGPTWRSSVDTLVKEGIIVAEYTKRMAILKVVSTGDKRRYKMRMMASKYRTGRKSK